MIGLFVCIYTTSMTLSITNKIIKINLQNILREYICKKRRHTHAHIYSYVRLKPCRLNHLIIFNTIYKIKTGMARKSNNKITINQPNNKMKYELAEQYESNLVNPFLSSLFFLLTCSKFICR